MSRPTVQSNQVTTVYAQAMPLDRTAIAASLGDRPLVKIDVEGAEVAVIDGMASVLALRPDIILETFSVANCARLNAELLPMGYSVFKIVESGKLEPLNMIMPADPNGEDFNQFLTVRPECVRDFL